MVIRKNKASISYRVNPTFLDMFKNAASLAGLSKNAYAAAIISDGFNKYYRYIDTAPEKLLNILMWSNKKVHSAAGELGGRLIRTDCILVPIEDAENLAKLAKHFGMSSSSVMKLLMLEDWFDLEDIEWGVGVINELARTASITRPDVLRWAVLTNKKHPFKGVAVERTEVSIRKKLPV